MHTIKFAAPRANMALAPSAARFGRWLVGVVLAREMLAAIPPEGSPCARDDEVDRAIHLLLGRPDPPQAG